MSLHGRNTYTAGERGLDDPVRLRKINEALHRISQEGCELVEDKTPRFSDHDFVKLMLEIVADLRFGFDFFDDIFHRD